MNDLDHFFREKYGQTPPATPPADGWDELRARWTGQTRHKRRFVFHIPRYWRWTTTLLFALGGAWWAATVPSEKINRISLHHPFPIELPAITPELPSAKARVVDRAARIDENNRQVDVDANSKPTFGPTSASQVDSLASTLYPNVNEANQSSSTPSQKASTGSQPDRRQTFPLSAPPPVNYASRVGRVIDTLVHKPLLSLKMEPRKFTKPQWRRHSSGSWEVSAAALPWVSNYSYSVGYLTTVRPANLVGRGSSYTLNGGSGIELYPTDEPLGANQHSYRTLSLPLIGIELARRTASGFRLSIGMSYSADNKRFGYSAADYAHLTDEHTYVEIMDNSKADYGVLSLGLNYTLGRYNRLQTEVGLYAIGEWYHRRDLEVRLLGGETFGDHFVRRTVSKDYYFRVLPIPLPQVTLRYYVRSNVAVSLGIGMHSGIGVSHRFRYTPRGHRK